MNKSSPFVPICRWVLRMKVWKKHFYRHHRAGILAKRGEMDKSCQSRQPRHSDRSKSRANRTRTHTSGRLSPIPRKTTNRTRSSQRSATKRCQSASFKKQTAFYQKKNSPVTRPRPSCLTIHGPLPLHQFVMSHSYAALYPCNLGVSIAGTRPANLSPPTNGSFRGHNT